MKFKAVQYLGLIALIFVFQGGVAVAADTSSSSSSSVLENIQHLVRGCVVRPYVEGDGVKIYGPLKSRCPEVRSSGAKAEIDLGNEKYVATLEESADADGGDLDNIEIKDSKGGRIARLNNVLAFGDILLGLAGADVELPELYAQPVASQ